MLSKLIRVVKPAPGMSILWIYKNPTSACEKTTETTSKTRFVVAGFLPNYKQSEVPPHL